MRFITVTIKDSNGDFVYLNIDHIVSISTIVHWETEEKYSEHALILLSNGKEIICDESADCIENENMILFYKINPKI